jgi:hypothetical protein
MRQETDIDPAIKQHIKTTTKHNYTSAILIGAIGGMAMIGFILFIEALSISESQSMGYKMLKYLVMAIPLAVGLSKLKDHMNSKYTFFQNGLLFAATASAVAAAIMMVAFMFTAGSDTVNLATFNSGITNIDELGQSDGFIPVLAGAMLFLEVFIMSMITSFAILLFKQDYARTA